MRAKWKNEGEDKILYYKCNKFSVGLLADGHGGDYVSSYIRANFVKILKTHISKEPILAVKDCIRDIANNMNNIIEGSTLVGVVELDNKLIMFNIGDSRCYALSPTNKLVQLSTDHNLFNNEEINRLKYIPSTNDVERRLDGILMMTRSIGDADVKSVISTPQIRVVDKTKYKRLLLVSDGVYECIPDDEIKKILSGDSLTKCVNLLIKKSINGEDDKSALVIDI